MEVLEYIDDFCREIDEATSTDQINLAVARQMRRLEFEFFNYTLFSHPEEGVAFERFHITNFPRDWVKYYIEQHFISDDMVFRHIPMAIVPFSWEDLGPLERFTPDQQMVFHEIRQVGIRTGASVPLRGPGRALGAFSVGNNMSQAQFTKLFNQHRHELHLLATYAHERIIAIGVFRGMSSVGRLTARETEILTWIARGKTKSEVGDILSLAEHTVKNHMKSVLMKLDTHTTVSAAVKGVTSGLIVP